MMLRNVFNVGRFLSSTHCRPIRPLLSMRCLSMQQCGSPNIFGQITPNLLVPLMPKISPTTYEKNEGKNILDLWKVPQHLPTSSSSSSSPISSPDKPQVEKQAARMIVIRRRKMKKHKLKKLRKVRKFEYRRMALKRKTKKEKEFQMKLMAQVKEADKFEAKSHVESIIRIAKEDLFKKQQPHPTFKRNPSLYDENGNRILLNKHLYGRK
ncbi:uncharacterized protein LOC130686759 [Daphnia carinata]|uniref:uncharacterized protein LOC130686759 n=1 Tax=Daphnia carinata TaxID=120202 RepID=UPI00257EFA37|nr:uncharacterized protein LOC130686759 [Daphnia carinata]